MGISELLSVGFSERSGPGASGSRAPAERGPTDLSDPGSPPGVDLPFGEGANSGPACSVGMDAGPLADSFIPTRFVGRPSVGVDGRRDLDLVW